MFARTPRLLLRPGWKEDAPALAHAIGDPAVVGRLARVPWPYRIEDAEAFLSLDHGPLPNFLIFARTHGTPRLVGGISLTANDAGTELGYWISRPYWGLGFATEAGHAVIELADTGLRLPRLVSSHVADNPASGRVLRKLGFELTGEVGACVCRSRNSVEASIEYARPAFTRGYEGSKAYVGYDREGAMAA